MTQQSDGCIASAQEACYKHSRVHRKAGTLSSGRDRDVQTQHGRQSARSDYEQVRGNAFIHSPPSHCESWLVSDLFFFFFWLFSEKTLHKSLESTRAAKLLGWFAFLFEARKFAVGGGECNRAEPKHQGKKFSSLLHCDMLR